MKKKSLFLFSLFFCSLSLFSQGYDGTYGLEMKFNEPGLSYKYHTCNIIINTSSASVKFNFKMIKPSTAATNYVLVNGSGSGSVSGSSFSASGSGTIQAYERGRMDTEFDCAFTMNGSCSSGNNEKDIQGTFEFTENGEPVDGTFTSSYMFKSGVKFSGLTGQVEVLFPGSNTWTLARMGMDLPYETHIKTSDESSAILSCSDMSTFVLKPESEIILTAPEGKQSKLTILMGDLWINVKKMIKDGNLEVEMTQAVAGIKGTTFVVENTGIKSVLKVIEGIVNYTSKANNKSIDVKAGETVSATNSGLSPKTSFNVAAEKAQWNSIKKGTASSSFNKIVKSPFVIAIAGVVILGIIVLILILIFQKRKMSKPVLQQQNANQGNVTYPSQFTQQQANPTIVNIVNEPPLMTPPTVKPQQFCTSCGAQLKPDAKFCHKCAKPVI